jgi:hypothetical protein
MACLRISHGLTWVDQLVARLTLKPTGAVYGVPVLKSRTIFSRSGTGSAPDTCADGAVPACPPVHKSRISLGRPGGAPDTCADWHCTLSQGLAWVGLVAHMTLARMALYGLPGHNTAWLGSAW